jgi:RNA polymerase sigma-70 factor (ECF subfamily)
MSPDPNPTEPPDPAPPGTIETLFLHLERPLHAYAMRILHHPEQAEDVVQDAFLRLNRLRDSIHQPRPWLYRTVHHLALNRLRDEARTQTLTPNGADDLPLPDQLADPNPPPDELASHEECLDQVRQGLRQLDPRSREVLRLKFEENGSYRDISLKTGLTPGHVGYLLHHALKAIADDLHRSGLLP